MFRIFKVRINQSIPVRRSFINTQPELIGTGRHPGLVIVGSRVLYPVDISCLVKASFPLFGRRTGDMGRIVIYCLIDAIGSCRINIRVSIAVGFLLFIFNFLFFFIPIYRSIIYANLLIS